MGEKISLDRRIQAKCHTCAQLRIARGCTGDGGQNGTQTRRRARGAHARRAASDRQPVLTRQCADQDAEHRRYGTHEWRDINGTGSYVQTIAAIDPMRSDNGPVMILPGSHKDGFLNLPEGDNRIKYVKEKDLVPVELAPGSVMFFRPYLIHGSVPNRTERPRRIFINGFSYPGANSRVYSLKGSACRVIYTS